MKRNISLGILFILILSLMTPWNYSNASSEPLFADEDLENAIKEQYELEELTLSDLQQIDYLDLSNWSEEPGNIDTLEGIQTVSNLSVLDIYNQPIDTLEPLKGMSLERVSARKTNISDLSPLEGWSVTDGVYFSFPENKFESLKGLDKIQLEDSVDEIWHLDFSGNQLKTIEELSAWKDKEFNHANEIDFSDNHLSDISPLNYLNVTDYVDEIDLSNNNISDVSPLNHFSVTDAVYSLNLANNHISDLTPIKDLLTKVEYIDVAGNPLNQLSLNLLATLEANGAYVNWGSNEGKINKWPKEDQNHRVNKINVPVDKTFTLKLNKPIDPSTFDPEDITIRDGQFEPVKVNLSLEGDRVIKVRPVGQFKQNTVYSMFIQGDIRSKDGGKVKPFFYAFKTEDLSAAVSIPDKGLKESLEAVIQEKLLPEEDVRITENTMKLITEISVSEPVQDFTGIEHAENITALYVSLAPDANLEPLTKLPKLKTLSISLWDSDYFNFKILDGMKQLEEIELNGVKDLYTDYENVDTLLQLPNLKKITIYQYDYNDNKAFIEKAEQKGIEVVVYY